MTRSVCTLDIIDLNIDISDDDIINSTYPSQPKSLLLY